MKCNSHFSGVSHLIRNQKNCSLRTEERDHRGLEDSRETLDKRQVLNGHCPMCGNGESRGHSDPNKGHNVAKTQKVCS